MRNSKNNMGSLHFPMLMAVAVLVLSGIGVWGLMNHWRMLVGTQLRLDRCIGSISQEFRNRMNTIERANSNIKRLRLAIVAATLEPSLIPPLKAGLTLEIVLQDANLAAWKLRQLQWVTYQGCLKPGDWYLPLPSMQWTRLPDDPLGPMPLQWSGASPGFFHIEAGRGSRTSAAQILRESEKREFYAQPKLMARWTTPKKFLARANLY